MESELESSWEATQSTARRNHFKGNRSFRQKYNTTFRQQKHTGHTKSKPFVESPVTSIELSTKHFITFVNLILNILPTATPPTNQISPVPVVFSRNQKSRCMHVFLKKLQGKEQVINFRSSIHACLSSFSLSILCLGSFIYIFLHENKRTTSCMRQTHEEKRKERLCYFCKGKALHENKYKC